MFVEVLLFIKKSNLNFFFDYIIPNNLICLAQKGSRVIVPFGNKNTPRLGYIVQVKNKSILANKYILDIPDKKPFLNQELFLLIEKILQTPFVSKTSAYTTIIPSGFSVSYKNKIFPLQKDLIPEDIKNYLEKKKWLLNIKDILFKTKLFNELINNKIVESKIIIKNFYEESQNIELNEQNNIKFDKSDFVYKKFLYKKSNFLINLNSKQKEVFAKINFDLSQTYLLYYYDKFEKIDFYLKIIEKNEKIGKQVLILVPEIITVNFLVKKIKDFYPFIKISILNGSLSKKSNYIQNKNIKSQKISVVVGNRSAIFAPLEKLGSIIIDDEHDESLIEKEMINYDSRKLALIRSNYHQIPLILTSNTPSLESYYQVKQCKYIFLDLSLKKQNFKMKLIDMKEELKCGNLEPISVCLMEKLRTKIKNKEKILLFINTRGFSPFVLCRFCGYILKCLKCNTNLTFFLKENILKCRFCNYSEKFNSKCLFCKQLTLKNVSFGIEYIEYFLREKFGKKIKISRIDSDSIKNIQQYEKIIKNHKEDKIDILLGTEMIDKKIDFDRITLVGIIMADVLLNMPSFRSSEKTFQLITQLAHYSEDKQNVIVQSYNIEHYAIQDAINYDVQNFLKKALKDRELSNNPPFVFLSKILIYNKKISKLLKIAKNIKFILEKNIDYEIKVLGPFLPRVFKKRETYRVFLTLKYKKWPLNLNSVQEYISQQPGTFIFFDLFASII
ncbi:replication restart helicase PriA [Candidatus Phytoplasma sacchari]|uniref:Replication restart protein PriA n=1 Tax=Candidatus Phytoplasma sacchari TaxID=2609813 RepID=A0ABY7M2A8_9MOLU|nr:primosomal protein N' [Candidatus Phytoplasma sacchari]